MILDNLIAQGKAQPMLVVMPLGYGIPGFAERKTTTAFTDKPLVRKNYQLFRNGLFQEVMPYVEKHYRVDGKRALAGLSMGGMETLFIGLNAPEKFQEIGAFSSGGFFDKPEETFPHLDADRVNKLVPFYLSCGVDDGLIQPNRELGAWLKEKGVKPLEVETPGRHAWMVWRRNLIDFASAIFKR